MWKEVALSPSNTVPMAHSLFNIYEFLILPGDSKLSLVVCRVVISITPMIPRRLEHDNRAVRIEEHCVF